MWLPWGSTDRRADAAVGLKRALRSVELLLTPELLLDILRTYTLYSIDAVGAAPRPIKIIPRYPQVEAVEAIVARATRPDPPPGPCCATTRARARRC